MVSNELDGMQFDVVVLGTGLEESIIASEAAAGGKSVLHVDRNPYYGGSNACFSLSKMLEWAFCHRNCCQTPSVEVLVGGQLTDAPTFVISGEASDQHDMDTLQRLAPFEL
ncbi:Rab proteins geranylgeranyltransferase component A, partial [Coemansia sp. RSA 353]